ncbi:MAG: ABC transporter permease [Clostridia bacterium]|nr:ABC transporter permease [Clostridia bacterium]
MALIFAEIKRMTHAIPKFLGMAVLLLALIGVLGAGGILLLDREDDAKIKIALSMPPTDDNIGGVVLRALEGMESVESALEITHARSYEQAADMLENGEVSAVISVPDGFLNGVIYGENIPASVLLRDGSSMECSLIVSGASAAEEMLKVSQSGVFAIFDAAKELYGNEADLDEVLRDANMAFIELIISRTTMFKIKETAMTGALTTAEFVAASCALLFISLMSAAVTGMFDRENTDFYKRLSALNVSGFTVAFSKLCSAFFLLLLPALSLGIVLKVMGMVYETQSLLLLLPIVLVCASMQTLIQSAVKNKMAAVIIQLTLSLALMFVSGGIMPEAFLPEYIIKTAAFLPMMPMLDTARAMFAGGAASAVWLCILWSCAMFSAAALCRHFSVRRGGA